MTDGAADRLCSAAAEFFRAGLCPQSRALCQKALEADRDHVGATHLMAAIELRCGRPDAALPLARRAADRRPTEVSYLNTLAAALVGVAEYAEAERVTRQTIALAPEHPTAYVTLGVTLQITGRRDEALAAFQEAVRLDAKDVDAHMNLADAYLRRGDYERGWDEFEWRPSAAWVREGPAATPGAVQWDGRAMPGRTLVVHGEQGLGDTIQFLRYLPMVAERVGTVRLSVQRSLFSLVRSMGIANVELFERAARDWPAGDAHVGLLSLARVFGTRINNVPGPWPYVGPSDEARERWRQKVGPGGGDRTGAGRVHIGVVWAGSSTNETDARRSMPLALFAPLAAIRGVRLHGLQVGGPARAQLRTCGFAVVDHADDVRDFDDTAGLVAALDLIVTVDTAVAHLAGALDKPVWTMVATNPDWRWMEEGDETPWYPSMRLFRQERAGDWQAVVARVARAVRSEVEGS